MKKYTSLPTLRLAMLPALTAALMACATSAPTNPALTEAQAVYQKAAADADVARSAPLELRASQNALNQAEAALKAGEDSVTVDHLAYLARQRATTALRTGEIARAEREVTEAGRERERMLLAARTREAEAGTAAALKARAQAEQAKQQAEQALQQAQKDRTQAEQARQESEQQLAAAEAARAKAAKLQKELTDLQAQQTDRGMVLTLGDVLFDTGHAQLKAGAFSTVERLAEFLRNNPERTVAIEGHTDSVGSQDYNEALSQRRADAVRMALIERGTEANRVTTKGLGKAQPVANNNTAEGRQRNRRVEVVISHGT
jgi:outer membrane protein OmpA-like peptidoglycan-associated protein